MRKWVELQPGEAAGNRFFGLARVIFRNMIAIDEPVVGIQFDTVAVLAAEQLVYRHAKRFAFNIPECDVDSANCRQERSSLPEPVHVPVKFGPDEINLARIQADDASPSMPTGSLDERRARPVGCLAPTVDAGVGFYFEKSPVVFDALD